MDAAPASVLRLARRPLGIALAMVVAAGAIVWMVGQRQDTARRDAADAAANLEQARNDLAEAQEARARLEANLRQYETLRGSGFVGALDRVAVLEALETAARDLAGVALRWELRGVTVAETVNDSKHQEPVAQVNVVPMRVAAEHVGEAEWLRFLAHLAEQPRGHVRVDRCRFTPQPLQSGGHEYPALHADCELAWVFLSPLGNQAGTAR